MEAESTKETKLEVRQPSDRSRLCLWSVTRNTAPPSPRMCTHVLLHVWLISWCSLHQQLSQHPLTSSVLQTCPILQAHSRCSGQIWGHSSVQAPGANLRNQTDLCADASPAPHSWMCVWSSSFRDCGVAPPPSWLLPPHLTPSQREGSPLPRDQQKSYKLPSPIAGMRPVRTSGHPTSGHPPAL